MVRGAWLSKVSSLGTSPRLTFQARLLHNNQEGVSVEKNGFRKISSRVFFRRIGRCSHHLGCGEIEPGKSVQGVCQDSDTYGGGSWRSSWSIVFLCCVLVCLAIILYNTTKQIILQRTESVNLSKTIPVHSSAFPSKWPPCASHNL